MDRTTSSLPTPPKGMAINGMMCTFGPTLSLSDDMEPTSALA